MIEKFFPKLSVDSIRNINFEILKGINIRGLILDIDNTLVPHYMKEADENAIKWINNARNAGLEICIVSNASEKRVNKFNEKINIYATHKSAKPNKKGFRKAQQFMNIDAEQVAVIGDQIFTDIYGGNKAGMYTILVKPIEKREGPLIRLKRFPEKFVLNKYNKAKSKQSLDKHFVKD